MARSDILRVRLPDLPSGSGHEQTGERPVVEVQSDRVAAEPSTVMIVPFTSKRAASRFPLTLRVHPSAQNGLATASTLLVFQLRALDRNRIIQKIGTLEEAYMEQLDVLMKELLDLM